MRRFFFYTGLLLLLSCGNSRQSKPSFSSPGLSGAKGHFSGEWVRADYAADILKTHSPLKSSELLRGIATLLVDTTELFGDSLKVGASWNNHEGYLFALVFAPGHDATSFPTTIRDVEDTANYYELGYKHRQKDTVLVLYHFNKTHRLLDSLIYEKAAESLGTDAADPIQPDR